MEDDKYLLVRQQCGQKLCLLVFSHSDDVSLDELSYFPSSPRKK